MIPGQPEWPSLRGGLATEILGSMVVVTEENLDDTDVDLICHSRRVA